MTAIERPFQGDVLAAMLRQDELKSIIGRNVGAVACTGCRARIGVVVDTSFGKLWLGLLAEHHATKQRESLGIPAKPPIPIWIDVKRSHYMGECDCPRNSVPGRYVLSAAANARKVWAPPQQDTPQR